MKDVSGFKRSNPLFHHIRMNMTLCFILISSTIIAAPPVWVGTWSAAQQRLRPAEMPPAPGLNNNSLRQIVRVSIGGNRLRFRFSNEYSSGPIILKSVQIATATGNGAINGATNKELKFGGKTEITMDAGALVLSDPVSFKLKPRQDVAITIYFGECPAVLTGHPGSRTTSYLLAGNTMTNTDFSKSITTDHWFCIDAIEVEAPTTAGAVAVLGNSITDGRGTTTNLQNRWTDILSERLLKHKGTEQVGVLNLGIGGNSVLAGGIGPTGASRYDRDILSQSGVRWAIVFEGVNDIGAIRNAAAAANTTLNLIDAYKLMIKKAHNKNIWIYGATIPPFKGNGYYNQYSDSCRNAVNEWIRHSGNYDGVIDFCKTMADPQDTLRIPASFQNDHLHPDAEGYKKMGESIDLKLFMNKKKISPKKK